MKLPSFIPENYDFAALVLSSTVLFAALHLFLWRGKRRRRTAIAAWLLLLLALIPGWLLVRTAGELETSRLEETIETYGPGPVFAAELQRLGHGQINESTPAEDARLASLKDAIQRWRAANPRLLAIETWRVGPDQAPERILSGGERVTKPQPPDGLQGAATVGKWHVIPTVEHGLPRISVLLPLMDEERRSDAVLFLAYDGTAWKNAVQRSRWTAICCLALLVLAVAAACSASALRRAQEGQTHADESRIRFEKMVHGIEPVVWEREPGTHRFKFVSEQAESLLGVKATEWVRREDFWKSTLHHEDRDRALAEMERCAASGKPWRVEYRLVAADGQEVWVRESGARGAASDGKPVLRGVLIDVSERYHAAQQLEAVNRQLLTSSRAAGMAEVATGVLHNVGNVLNSVTVSATLLQDRLRESRASSLSKVVEMLTGHSDDLARFLTEDERGRQVPWYLSMLAGRIDQEHTELRNEIEHLLRNVEHIREIVAMQQSYAKLGGRHEQVTPADIMEDAVRVHTEAFTRHAVRVERRFSETPSITVDRHKLIQILVNLLANAKQAMDDRPREERLITLTVCMLGQDGVRLAVTDSGTGIAPENLTRIFQHGFTTRAAGHGFGLHSSANAAREMGGDLTVHSEGPGRGATFMLDLPFKSPDSAPPVTPVTSTTATASAA